MSIFNLIPSCPTCNHIKGSKENHLHPYTEEMGDNAKFTLSMSCLGELEGIKELGFGNKFKDKIEYKEFTNGFSESRELNFNLEEGFSKRVELKIKNNIAKDLKDRIKNSKEIFQLENKYSGVREEIRDLYFKHNYFGARKTDEYKRPLSKFINYIRDFLDDEDQDDF